ncbi:MAG: pyrroloquinoline quinone biosynthesis protein PqqE [Nitrospira sp.]|nr:pyrroloquinoline quinone biosynthesis protein PqqE [Nitrospira sp.]
MKTIYRPYTLIAELTHRCPLRCPYCSNPTDLVGSGIELDTETWQRVFDEAEALGVVQVNLSGGEPLLRDDLERLIERAAARGLYSNLITSGIPLTVERLGRLKACGLDSVQVSVQDARQADADAMAGGPVFGRKLAVMRWVKSLGLPLTMNVVLHRENLGEIEDIIRLAERIGPDRLELANVQYLGWALRNRTALLPTREQIERARPVAIEAKRRLRGTMDLCFVLPDYYADRPKACMDGWGRRYLVVNPEGLALPCHLACTIPGLSFDNVRQRPLAEIWERSDGFNRFRGEEWLPDPCRSCPSRTEDFGGCRCQAYHVTGNAGAADPACALAPDHRTIEAARDRAVHQTGTPVVFEYRDTPRPVMNGAG